MLLEAKVGLNTCKLATLEAHNIHLLTSGRYGMVLAKEKNDQEALNYFIQSVHKYPMNWGCWLEMASLITRVEDVSVNCRPPWLGHANQCS